MKIYSKDRDADELYWLMIGAIVPRPIALVSTANASGQLNAAPFSFFSGFSSEPPSLTLAIGRKDDGSKKDTLRNIEDTREFVVNVVHWDIAQKMVNCSAAFDYGVSEFEKAGFTPAASELIAPPRIAESKISMECRLLETVEIGSIPSTLVIGEILMFHIADQVISGLDIKAEVLNPVARLNYRRYAHLSQITEIKDMRIR